MVLNAELRAIVGKLFNRNLTVVGFVDSGQVFREADDLDLGAAARHWRVWLPLRLAARARPRSTSASR